MRCAAPPATHAILRGRLRRALIAAGCFVALLLAAPAAPAQQARCDKPLGLDDLVSLLETRVSDTRVQQMITDCGITFAVDDATEKRIRKAGGSRAVVALARLAATRRGPAAADAPTEGAVPRQAARPSGAPPLPGASAPASADADWVEVARDESSLERRVRDYLEAKGMALSTNDKPDDLLLYLSFADEEGTPAYDVSIDTLSSARDDSERAIRVSLFSRQIIDTERLDEVLRLINQHHGLHWPGMFRVDGDAEVVAEWYVNIPGAGYRVHLEQVRDTIQRLGLSWSALHKEVRPLIVKTR